MKTTVDLYKSFDIVYDHMNKVLFGGTLPLCIITLKNQKGSHGFLKGKSFESTTSEDVKKTVDELALNPVTFSRPSIEVASTIVHEMAHLWQIHFGDKGPSGGYHNKEWANKMEEIGLIPSDTGQEGGKKTGRKMTHFIEKDGPFYNTFKEIEFKLEWKERGAPSKVAKEKNKIKYICPQCGIKAWGKPELKITCTECDIQLEPS